MYMTSPRLHALRPMGNHFWGVPAETANFDIKLTINSCFCKLSMILVIPTVPVIQIFQWMCTVMPYGHQLCTLRCCPTQCVYMTWQDMMKHDMTWQNITWHDIDPTCCGVSLYQVKVCLRHLPLYSMPCRWVPPFLETAANSLKRA
jgi:hypothetical protein